MIPKHRIPRIKPLCIACGSDSVSTVMSQPFAEGYHRRHICNNCSAPFYTMALYDGKTHTTQARPFKDRALTSAEKLQRLEWAAEARPVTMEVENPFATPFLENVNHLFRKEQQGVELSPHERSLVIAIRQIENETN